MIGNLTREHLINQAIRITYAVTRAGGMATKSFIEDFLMLRYPGLTRFEAHGFLNDIERDFLDKNLTYRSATWKGEGEEPTLDDYPEIVFIGKVRRAEMEEKS